KSLNHADPELTDQLKVIVGFDTLGAGVHAERLGKSDDGTDDRGVAVGGRRRAADKALIDLDLVERRLLQIAERAVACTEVVKRKPDSEVLQLGESIVGAVAVGQEHPLGDLE